MIMVDISNFYFLGSKLVMTTFTATPFGLKQVEKAGELPYHLKLHTGDYQGFSFPIVFKQTDGKVLRDLLDTGFACLFLISDNMKSLLESYHFTGWKTFPAKVFDKHGNEIEGYHGFSVTGRGGHLGYKTNEIIEKPFFPGGPLKKFYKGVTFDSDKWDGSDFLLAEKSYGIIVTRNVVDKLKSHKLTNVRFESFTDETTLVEDVPVYFPE